MTKKKPRNPPPTYSTPRTAERDTLGPFVGEISEMLGRPFMPWQQHVADIALELDEETGLPVYREVVLLVPRQAGKSTLFLALLVHRCFATWKTGPQNVVYTAQSRNDARKKWLEDYVEALEESPLRHQFTKSLANGAEGLSWANKSHFGLSATTKKAGHGPTLDLGLLDEAFSQIDTRITKAWRPAMATRQEAQLWITSTAGDSPEDSPFLFKKVVAGRENAAAGKNTGTAYFEWSDHDSDISTPELLTEAAIRIHPAVGYTITEGTLAADIAADDDPEDSVRGYLNRWGKRTKNVGPITVEDWEACGVSARQAEIVGTPTMAYDVPPDRETASITAAGSTRSGRSAIEIIDLRDGVEWAPMRLKELHMRHKFRCVVIDGAGPAANIIDDLDLLEVPYAVIGLPQMAKACATIRDRVVAVDVVHCNQPEMVTAIAGSKKKALGDRWTWSRSSSTTNISPLVGGTIALFGHETELDPDGESKKPGPTYAF